MWILNYVTKNSINSKASEQGSVQASSDGLVHITASSDYAAIPIVAPYGITYCPPAGEKSVVISTGDSDYCAGTVSPNSELAPGELMLSSKGGARILLKNDGYVYINGRRME